MSDNEKEKIKFDLVQVLLTINNESRIIEENIFVEWKNVLAIKIFIQKFIMIGLKNELQCDFLKAHCNYWKWNGLRVTNKNDYWQNER